MKLAFVFDGLGCGGIERVGIDYCNALCNAGHEIVVVNLSPQKNEFVHQLDSRIQYHALSFSKLCSPECYVSLTRRPVWGKFAYPLFSTLCGAIDVAIKPLVRYTIPAVDIAIAFSGHFNDLTFVSKGLIRSSKRVAWLHGTISSYAIISEGFPLLYQRFNALVCLGVEGDEEFQAVHTRFKVKKKVIYNPITIGEREIQPDIVSNLKAKYGQFALMVMRLSYPEKDPYTAIRALRILNAGLKQKRHLVIVGDGPEKQKLIDFINKEHMQDYIHMAGQIDNPAPYYAACDFFIHASAAAEGLPTVILEALHFSKPVIATDVRSGPREILGNGRYGILCKVQNPEDMAHSIEELITSPELYSTYAKRAPERIADFEPSLIYSQLIGYLNEVMYGAH